MSKTRRHYPPEFRRRMIELVRSTRREFLDHTSFWNARDLERKLYEFRDYHNLHRVHGSLGGKTPAEAGGETVIRRTGLHRFRWQGYCRGLFELPMAA